MNQRRTIQILVPVLILAGVVAIWVVKNKPAANPLPAPQATSETVESTASPTANPDFALEASALDVESLTAYGLPIVIDFGSDSCIPCKEMAPVLQSVNAGMQGKAIVKFVDVWENPGASDGFPLQVIPTQVFIGADGKPYQPSEAIGSQMQLTQYVHKETGELAFTVHQGGLTEEQLRLILADMGAAQ